MRSRYEEMVAATLDDMGVRYEYEAYRLQYYRPVAAAHCEECGGSAVVRSGWYTPDFWLPDYRIFIEAKGKFTSRDRTKMQAVVDQHTDERFLMMFMADNKINPRSTTRYSTWCTKTGLSYLIAPKCRSGRLVRLEKSDMETVAARLWSDR